MPMHSGLIPVPRPAERGIGWRRRGRGMGQPGCARELRGNSDTMEPCAFCPSARYRLLERRAQGARPRAGFPPIGLPLCSGVPVIRRAGPSMSRVGRAGPLGEISPNSEHIERGRAQKMAGAALLALTMLLRSPAYADELATPHVDSIPASAKEAKELSKRNSRVTGDAAGVFARAKKAAEAGRLEEAAAQYDALIRVEPNFAGGYSNRANVKVARREYDGAVDDYSKAIELAPLASDTWVVYLNRGCVFQQMGRAEDALRDFNRALDLRPDESKWDLALSDYRKAVEKKPNDVEPFWLDYCLALFQRGNSTEAVSILKRVVSKYPSEPLVRAALAAVLFDRGDIAGAETNWSTIERPRPLLYRQYLEDHRWPPKAIQAMERFKTLSE